MHNDIQVLVNENVSLKKCYQISKKHEQSLQQQTNRQKTLIAELEQTLIQLKQQNHHLHQKNKRMQTDLSNSNTTFVQQIQQLKNLIQEKQRQMQDFQLKMLPVVDQDMLRVKLIAQMEGPYQEVVDRKDRQILKLKDQLHQTKREKQIFEFSLVNKEKEYKNQIEENRKTYQRQIESLQKHISHISTKMNTGKFQKQMIKNQRNQIDQLRAACQFHKNQEDEQRKELLNLRLEKEKLVADLGNANTLKAIEIRNNNNEQLIKQLKARINKMQDEKYQIQSQLQKAKSKIITAQNDKKKMQYNFQLQISELKSSLQKQRSNKNNQVLDYHSDIRKLREQKATYEQKIQKLQTKYRNIQNSFNQIQTENLQLKAKINIFEQQSDRFNHNFDQHSINKKQIKKTQRELIEKEIYIKVKQELMNEEKRRNTSPNKQGQICKNDKQKIIKLEQKIKKISEKLQFANKKIMQLLQQKCHRQNMNQTSRGRSFSTTSPQQDKRKIVLQHRDCGFVPLCPPTVMQPLPHLMY